jgi:glycosyltransferase involved in cell wall biosynthesis
MNIGILTAGLTARGGGVWVVVRELARNLGDLQAGTVTLFGSPADDTDAVLRHWNGPPVRTYAVRGPEAFGYSGQLLSLLRNAELDVLHSHGLWMYFSHAAKEWAREKRAHVVSPHGMLDPWAVTHSGWKKKAVGWLFENDHLTNAACIHALAAAEVTGIRAYGLRNPVCVIPSGVDLPGDGAEGAMPPWSEFVARGTKVLFYIGRLHPKKGLALLIEALAMVFNTKGPGQDWVLVIAGWQELGYGDELRDLVRERDLERCVFFVGELYGGKKDAAYRNADAFILPSYSEGLPITILEAWSYGLPVVMTRHCNLPEGFQCSAAIEIDTTKEDIARGLQELFSLNDAALEDIGRAGRALVERKFTWRHCAREMREVYGWLTGGGTPPACVVTG